MADTIFRNVMDAQPGAGMSLRGTLTQAADAPPFSFMRDFGALQQSFQQQAQDQTPQPPVKSITHTAEGRVQGDFSEEFVREAFSSMALKKQIMEGYANQAAQLKQREDQLKSSVGGTIANVLATVAGNLAANDPKLPGWVRGLGAASLQLNPTAQQLGQQRMGLEKVLMEAAGEQAQTGMAIAGHMQSQAQATRRLDIEEFNALSNEENRLSMEADRIEKARASVVDRYNDMATKDKTKADPVTMARELLRTGAVRNLEEAIGAVQRQHQMAEGRIQADKATKAALNEEQLGLFKQEQAIRQKDALALEGAKIAGRKSVAAQQADAVLTRSMRVQKLITERMRESKTLGIGMTTVPDKDDTKALTSYNELDQNLDRMQKAIEKHGDAFGPISGRVIGAFPWKDPETFKAFSASRELFLQVIRAGGEKLGRMTEFDAKRYEAVLADNRSTVGQIMAIMGEVRTKIDAGRKAIAITRPNPKWWKARPGIMGPRLQEDYKDIVSGKSVAPWDEDSPTMQGVFSAPEEAPAPAAPTGRPKFNPATGKIER